MENTMRKVAWEGLQRNIVIEDDRMIVKMTAEVLNPEVNSTYSKEKF